MHAYSTFKSICQRDQTSFASNSVICIRDAASTARGINRPSNGYLIEAQDTHLNHDINCTEEE